MADELIAKAPNPLLQTGAAVGGGILSRVFDIWTNEYLQKQNYKWGKKAADDAYAKELDMYERMYRDKSPVNIAKQLAEAGLNKGLMYSSGGQIGGAANATSQPQAQQYQTQKLDSGLALTLAQIANINADTKKKEAETTNIGAGTETIEATRESIVKEINTKIDNLKADTALKAEQQNLIQLQQDTTKIANEFNAKNNATMLEHNLQVLRKMTAEANVSEQTQQSLVELAKKNVQLAASQMLLNNSEIQLNDSEKKLITAKIGEITNSIIISKGQLYLNKESLKQALEIEKMKLSGGTVVNNIRGVATLIKNAIYSGTGTTVDYSW